MTKPKEIFLFLLFCLLSVRHYGQSNPYIFSHLDFANGLSNNHVTCIYKDAKGFMWFGTMSGLNRYDGYQFKVFKHDQKDPHSIDDNYIEQIFEGPDGKLWVRSRTGGFNIYDFDRDQFDPAIPYLGKRSLPKYYLQDIIKAKSGFWFVYLDTGLYRYLPDGRVLDFKHKEKEPGSVDSSKIGGAAEDSHGDLWVIHQNGVLEKIDGLQNKVVYRTGVLQREFGNSPLPCSLYVDRQDDLWIYSDGVFKGVYYYHPATREVRHLWQASGEGRLNSNVVIHALQDGKGLVWLATDHGGVDIVDKKDFSVKYLQHVEDDNKSLAENSVDAMYRDSTGTIWLGTYKSGISYYHQNSIQFPQYRHQPFSPGSLPYDDINGFVEDPAGNVWIASNGGGLIYWNRKLNIFRQYVHDPAQSNSLCNNIIVSMLLDKENKLWIGTYFGGLDCYDGKTFTHYRHRDAVPTSLSDDRIMCLYEDTDRNLWVGTLAEGLDRLDRRKNIFYHYNNTQPNSIRNNYVSSITEDEHKNLWIATGFGIDVLEKGTQRFIHYSDSNQLSCNSVISLFRDSHNNIWAGTREGLDLFLPDKQSFQSFGTVEGLPDNTVRSIVEDSRHRLWISTANGIAKILPVPSADHGGIRIRCQTYHEQDGLQAREFNERAGLATRDGTILFGGQNGFNGFHPETIVSSRDSPPIVLTGLEIFNNTVHAGEKTGDRVILQNALSETPEITLHYNENVFSIEFASLGFIYNANNKYTYTLENFNKNWLVTDGKIRKATYTNLDAGEYTFRVKASNEDGEWYDQEASLKIIVLPPFWKTPVAYLLYLLLTAIVLFLARRMIIQRAKLRFALDQERKEAKRMHEMDLMKIRFFTNMSHELRTPLSLILAPVEKLLKNPQQPDPKKQYEVIRRNAKRLLHLVNQLLDFRKMEVNELKLNTRLGNVMKFMKDISVSFIDLAEKKNISFSYHDEAEALYTFFDHDKIERILFNLLSNAFKFTPENGAVTIEVHTERYTREDTVLRIKVKDTGIGIAADKQEKIFERFFQTEVPNTILNQGSGIGLAITLEFVKMHHGHLSVESELNKGSCFTITLPFKEIAVAGPDVLAEEPNLALHFTLAETHLALRSAPSTEARPARYSLSPADQAVAQSMKQSVAQSLAQPTSQSLSQPASKSSAPQALLPKEGPGGGPMPEEPKGPGGQKWAQPAPPGGATKRTVLIVEDNEDFRFYLKDNLRAFYTIVEASDGKEGWQKSLALHPDLVVSDISMPIMSGIELCEKIKKDERTCQIPVILLTAMAGEGNELKSLKTGATDYIIKPFNFEVLLSKVKNILEYNETIKKTYQRQVQANPAALTIESADDAFMQNVLSLIEKNMGNPDFTVAELSIQFHASRSTIYKRLLLLTGKTPLELIRQIRLKRAAELLEKSQLSVSEIAYTVGFNNPKYFAQYFKMEFNIIPSAYRSQKRTK
jgi:signal transduction histidine kinase/ligand-binding sensor domain-containing protein/DNA-binding response OmpR family regulator